MELVNKAAMIRYLILTSLSLIASQSLGLDTYDHLQATGYTNINFTTTDEFESFAINRKDKKEVLQVFCQRLEKYFKKYSWKKPYCAGVNYKLEYFSNNRHPLLYKVYGTGKLTTLFFSGVHPDELTPIPLGFKLIEYLDQQKELYTGKNSGVSIVVAPLVNPDGFLRNIPTRTNANRVDLNRNFFTLDWYERAKQYWVSKKNGNIRRFPGYFPSSEIETHFQQELIGKHEPDKIISIHAPLGFLDYDGPGDQKRHIQSKTIKKAKELVHAIAKESKNYRVVDYSFYPGSLGNYAGAERHIPTITLELQTTNPKKAQEYWDRFIGGLKKSIHYPVDSKQTANINKRKPRKT